MEFSTYIEDENDFVYGCLDLYGATPITQGSKRYVGGGRIVDQNINKIEVFREQLKILFSERPHPEFAEGKVFGSVFYVFPRPKNHFRTGKYSGELKEEYKNIAHTSRPDVLKLQRTFEDALSGIIWKDDSQVSYGNLEKFYHDRSTRNHQILFYFAADAKEKMRVPATHKSFSSFLRLLSEELKGPKANAPLELKDPSTKDILLTDVFKIRKPTLKELNRRGFHNLEDLVNLYLAEGIWWITKIPRLGIKGGIKLHNELRKFLTRKEMK